MPKPPQQRAIRASRKHVLYGYISRWYDPDRGLDPWEWTHLHEQDYGRWVARKRLTADMVVALVFHALDRLDDVGQDHWVHPYDERARMVEILRMRIRTPPGEQPPDQRDEELRCLSALEKLQSQAVDIKGPRFQVHEDGSVEPEPERDQVAHAWRAIRRRYRTVINDLATLIEDARDSEETLRLGPGHRATIIHLGDRASARAEAQKLRAELGTKFLTATTTATYRAACIRKWKQLLMTRPDYDWRDPTSKSPTRNARSRQRPAE